MTASPHQTLLGGIGEQPMADFRTMIGDLSARGEIGDSDDLRVRALSASGHRPDDPLYAIDPTQLVADGPRPGDLLVRRAPGEGLHYLGVIVGDYIGPAEIFAARGVTVEAAGPGLYVEVAEVPFGGN